MLFPSHLSALDESIYDECDNDYMYGSFKYFDLYLKLEDSLINYYKSPAILEELRAVFLNAEANYIRFEVHIQVVNGTNVSCDGDIFFEPPQPAFCPASSDTSEYEWELCQRMDINYINTPFFSELKSKNTIFMINYFLVWASHVHSNGLSHVLVLSNLADYIWDDIDPQFWNNDVHDFIPITIRIDRLDCNPYMRTMTCDALDLFSWVSRACIIGSKALV